jgi:hypothetical protein
MLPVMFWTHPSKLPTAEGFFINSPYCERARLCVFVMIVKFWFYKKGNSSNGISANKKAVQRKVYVGRQFFFPHSLVRRQVFLKIPFFYLTVKKVDKFVVSFLAVFRIYVGQVFG